MLFVAFVISCMMTHDGFFFPDVPLWFAGMPLIAAIVTGGGWQRGIAFGGLWPPVPGDLVALLYTASLRLPWYGGASLAFVAIAAFFLWPALLSAAGLHGIGFHPLVVWPAAVIAVIGLAWLASLTGVALLALIVTLVPAFPASPLLVLADAVPGTGLFGPIVILVCLAIVEFMPGRRKRHMLQRAGAVAMIAVGVAVWNLAMIAHPDASMSGSGSAAAANTIWQEMDEPRAVSEHGRWIALRDTLPEGGEAIFGENFFRADDHDAITFWCDAARRQNPQAFPMLDIGMVRFTGWDNRVL